MVQILRITEPIIAVHEMLFQITFLLTGPLRYMEQLRSRTALPLHRMFFKKIRLQGRKATWQLFEN